MKQFVIVVTLVCISIIHIRAQDVDILIDFDLNNNQYQAKESKDKPRSIFAAQQHEFAEGLSGRAIDFSVA